MVNVLFAYLFYRLTYLGSCKIFLGKEGLLQVDPSTENGRREGALEMWITGVESACVTRDALTTDSA